MINGASSSWSEVLNGVPQGSIFGLLLFLIFTNDIYIGIISRLLKFADDTKVFANVQN